MPRRFDPPPTPPCQGGGSCQKPVLSDDLDQHALPPSAVELAVEDLLPRAEIQLPIHYRYHHLPPHHLAFQVRIGIILTGAVVPVLVNRLMRCESFQPNLIVMVETTFDKIDQIYTKPDYRFRL